MHAVLETTGGWVIPSEFYDEQKTVLIPDELFRVFGNVKLMTVPSLIAELADEPRGIELIPERCYAFADAMEHQWKTHDVFPCDPARVPERYHPHDLPTIVKRAMARTYHPYENREALKGLLAVYQGCFLADVADEAELKRVRQSPVETTLCRVPGCSNRVVTTVDQAARTIRRHRLIELDKPFRPHKLCQVCARTHRPLAVEKGIRT